MLQDSCVFSIAEKGTKRDGRRKRGISHEKKRRRAVLGNFSSIYTFLLSVICSFISENGD
jgi:hypothetical protein